MKKYKFIFLLISFLLITSFIISACSTKDEKDDVVVVKSGQLGFHQALGEIEIIEETTSIKEEKKNEKTIIEGGTINSQEAAEIAESFINKYLMIDGSRVSVSFYGVAYDMYHLKVSIEGQLPVDSYITKDGKLFFPQHLDIAEIEQIASGQETGFQEAEVPKTDKPIVELFVMTYCPFSTQIQKGLLPVLDEIGDDIYFQQLYVDYAMQGKKELDENLLQYCIEEEEGTEQLMNYLECFLAAENQSENCFNQVVNNPANINNCVEEVDQEFNVSKNYQEEINWRGNFPGFEVNQDKVFQYGVSGAPALVINGVEVPANRDAASLLNQICDAFSEKPDVCNVELSNITPTPGFGF